MEMVLFIGIQATGKSAYYLEQFYRTHVRINRDMLKTRHREDLLIRGLPGGKNAVCGGQDEPHARGSSSLHRSRQDGWVQDFRLFLRIRFSRCTSTQRASGFT